MNSKTYSNLGGWDAPQGRAAMPDSTASGAVPCAVCGCLGNMACGHAPLDQKRCCTLDGAEVCPCCRIKCTAGAQPTISERDLSNAVMQECSCGGGGPDDKHTCQACKVYHRLVTLRPNAKRSDRP